MHAIMMSGHASPVEHLNCEDGGVEILNGSDFPVSRVSFFDDIITLEFSALFPILVRFELVRFPGLENGLMSFNWVIKIHIVNL